MIPFPSITWINSFPYLYLSLLCLITSQTQTQTQTQVPYSELNSSAMNGCQSESHTPATKISAIILDLDGTLLNTETLTKDLLKEFLTKYGKVIDTEKENKRFGMIHKDSAIGIVKDYDLPMTPNQYSEELMPMYREKWLQAKALPGANRLIKHLHKHGVPFALASNSVRKNIDVKVSRQQGWKESFSVILGSDQVKSGKPSPDLFLEAAKQMGVDASCCLVIEDSLVGVKAAKAAKMKVVAVPSLQSEYNQYFVADYVLHSLLDFQPEIWGLPPFEDWVVNALPIEPIYFKGLFKSGTLHEITDDEASAIPDQLSGVYFGWAKTDSDEISKIVISIKWDHGCCNSKRNIQGCLINGSSQQTCDQPFELMLVGYIRGFTSKGDTSSDTQILDKDKSIASASLELSAFAFHSI